MGKGKFTKRVKLRKRYQTKSKIAAYIKGKIKLSGIMHPSRIAVVDRKPRFNFDIVNQSTPMEQHKTRRQTRKKPALKDYIAGKVSVSEMLPPGKMNEIPPKTRQLQIFQMQNFFSPEWNRYRNENTANVRQTRNKKTAREEKHGVERTKKRKVETPESRVSCGDSVRINGSSINALKSATKSKASTSVESFMPIDEINSNRGDIGSEKVKQFLMCSCSKQSYHSSTGTAASRTIDKFTPKDATSSKLSNDFNITPKEDQLKFWNSCFKVTPQASSSQLWNGNFKPNSHDDSQSKLWNDVFQPPPPINSSKLWSDTSMKRVMKEKEDIIKAHENIERHLLRQIIHLRRNRDKYKTAFKDIRNLVRILSEKSNYSCFKRLNID